MVLQVGVKLVIRDQNGKHLLLKRNLDKYKTDGQWDIPGGRIDPAASLLSNLKREVKEETQLELIAPVFIIGAQDILVANRDDRGVLSGERHIVRLTYYGEMEHFEPKINDEHIDFGWYTKAEMTEMDLDKYLKELLENDLIP